VPDEYFTLRRCSRHAQDQALRLRYATGAHAEWFELRER
jgi:hypothetical protein